MLVLGAQEKSTIIRFRVRDIYEYIYYIKEIMNKYIYIHIHIYIYIYIQLKRP